MVHFCDRNKEKMNFGNTLVIILENGINANIYFL